jgi:hypothetical protein
MKKTTKIPKFTWIILILIGVFDLWCGFIHTIWFERAISVFVHMDLSASNVMDQQF